MRKEGKYGLTNITHTIKIGCFLRNFSGIIQTILGCLIQAGTAAGPAATAAPGTPKLLD